MFDRTGATEVRSSKRQRVPNKLLQTDLGADGYGGFRRASAAAQPNDHSDWRQPGGVSSVDSSRSAQPDITQSKVSKRSRALRRVRYLVANLNRRHFMPYPTKPQPAGLSGPSEANAKGEYPQYKLQLMTNRIASLRASGMHHAPPPLKRSPVGSSGLRLPNGVVPFGPAVRTGSAAAAAIAHGLRHHSAALPQPPRKAHGKSNGISRSKGMAGDTELLRAADISGEGVEWAEAALCENGDVYEGWCCNGARHGFGVCAFSSGDMYEGDWRDGVEQGRGAWYDASDALIYRGEFLDGRMHGRGTYFFGNGDRYDGDFFQGSRHGRGIYRQADGSVFDGEWVRNCRHGHGIFTGANGSSYSGEWYKDCRHGRGELLQKNGFHFDGYFKDGLFDGKGTCTYPGGGRYEGTWRRNLKDGRGTYTFTNGTVYEGRFRADQIDGTGTVVMERGKIVDSSGTGITGDDEWMSPVDSLSEMRFMHLKAGFGEDGT